MSQIRTTHFQIRPRSVFGGILEHYGKHHCGEIMSGCYYCAECGSLDVWQNWHVLRALNSQGPDDESPDDYTFCADCREAGGRRVLWAKTKKDANLEIAKIKEKRGKS
jgi:hypothetical protein